MMSLLKAFQSKPLVVQRLTFVWSVLALYPMAMVLIEGFFYHRWEPFGVVVYLIASALLAALAWGHFRRAKVAWSIGVFLSGIATATSVITVPMLITAFKALYHFQMQFSQHPTAAQRARLMTALGLRNWAIVSTCASITTLLLLLVAFVLAISPAGRAAYRIGRRHARTD